MMLLCYETSIKVVMEELDVETLLIECDFYNCMTNNFLIKCIGRSEMIILMTLLLYEG